MSAILAAFILSKLAVIRVVLLDKGSEIDNIQLTVADKS